MLKILVKCSSIVKTVWQMTSDLEKAPHSTTMNGDLSAEDSAVSPATAAKSEGPSSVQTEKNSDKSSEKSQERKLPTWRQVDNDLKKALDSWEVLTEQMATKESPEQEQLNEVKRLLSELKSKIQEFN